MNIVDSQSSTLSEIESHTLADLAFKHIQTAIIRGELAPGARLDEIALARVLGISRGPLREAFRRLEERKLLERKPRAGVSVVDLRPQDVRETFLIREALEGMAARLAADRISEDELAKLEVEVELQAERLSGGAIYEPEAGDFTFHLAVAQASRNARLQELLSNDLLYLLCIYRCRSARSAERAKVAMAEHRAVVQAFRARNGEAAERLMRQHIRRASTMFQSGWDGNDGIADKVRSVRDGILK